MDFLVTELSKIIVLAVIGLYCIESYLPLFKPMGDKNKGVYIRQYIYTLLLHTLGMVILYLESGSPKYLFLWFAQVTSIFLVNRFSCIIFPKLSGMLINHMCFLLSVGFVVLSRLDFDLAVRQFRIVVISFVIFILITLFVKKFKYLDSFTAIYGAVGAILLFLVLSLGRVVNGSKLSFKIMGLNFQSSEIVKILFVFFIAGMLCENAGIVRVLITSALAAVFIGMLALSKDLGSALIYYIAFLVIVVVATGKFWYSIVGLIIGSGAAVVGYRIFTHVQVRIAVWLDPWTDIDKTGYQLTQSLFAIGTGGWFGLGLGKGTPNSIPFVDEDFIFSAICEELGVLFGIFLILICAAVFVLFVKISLRTENMFYKLIAVGLGVIYIMQVVLTIGGGTRFIPLTGVTLPLISSGGSSLMTTVFIFAVVQGIVVLPKKRANQITVDYAEDEEDEEVIEEALEEAEKKSKRRRINAYIICGFNLLVCFGIVYNLVDFMLNDSQEAIANSYNNKRVELMASENYRGNIYSSDGYLLATTKVTEDKKEIREYPYKDVFCHVVGYTGYGKTGIESTYNLELIKSDVAFTEKMSNDNKGIKNPGNNVYSTIDADMQQLAYDLLGVYDGAVVVTEAKTGKILVMVSKPTFDANSVSENWASLSEDKDAPLFNRASQGLYPPGSTFKIVTALEYIRENESTYNNFGYNCVGSITNDGVKINCFRNSVHGQLTLTQAFAKSCNSSFASIGLMLDRQEFADTLTDLLFNVKLPTDFDTSASYITMRDDMDAEAVMQTAIGQYKTVMTPLHLNMITAAIANKGDMMVPYVVDRVESADGKVLAQNEPVLYKNVMSEAETKALTDLMVSVVEEGTASKLSGQSYSVAGKTGSAEFNSSKHDSHAWFTGFAPAEDPEIVITVLLEDAGTGGEHSVPIAKQLFSLYFDNK